MLVPTAARFHERYPAIELRIETATRAEWLRLLGRGETDLHCGGLDAGERLPDHLRKHQDLWGQRLWSHGMARSFRLWSR